MILGIFSVWSLFEVIDLFFMYNGLQIFVVEVRDRQDRFVKMRSFFFRYEMKVKYIKKIKLKIYYRLKKKDRLKLVFVDLQIDFEVVREFVEK